MIFSTTILNRVVATSVVTTSVVLSPFFGAIAQADTLNGAGATFPAPLYERYAREVKKKYPDLKINWNFLGRIWSNQFNRWTCSFDIANILTGVPSIVVGVFAYGVIVLVTKGFSAIAGSFALAVIMLPVIILTTEESLKLIPTSGRLASAALGGTPFQTTFRIVILA